MKFTFRLFVQKHANRSYTVTVPLFPGVAAYGPALEECKQEVTEALAQRLAELEPQTLHLFEFQPNQTLEKVTVELRPTDHQGKRRRNKIKLTVSLLLTPEEDGQILVMAPRLRHPPLTFYVNRSEELGEVAQLELAQYFHEASLEHILLHQPARYETLDTLEVEFKPKKATDRASEEEDERFWALKASGVNLSAQVIEGQLRRAYRREREVEEILAALAGERRPSILLLGPSGVGKTAIVYETVRRIHRRECAEVLHARQVWAITGDSLIAGCSYIGQWQEKVNDLVREVRKKRHLLFVEDIASLAEVGRWSKGDENIADFLKSFVQSGDVVIIGECTPERLRLAEQLSPGFVAQFRTLEIAPTSPGDTISILTALGRELERGEEIRIEPSALEAAVELTTRFQPYRPQPGKAATLLEQVAADAGRSAKAAPDAPRPTVTRKEVVSGFTKQTGLPEFIVADNVALDLDAVRGYFADRIIGQGAAVEAMVDLIAMIKAGLNDPGKPLGVYLFIGPTGVGKTQLAKTLAKYLFGDERRMIRFDMSEYNDPVAVRRLLGVPGSGREGAGELSRQVRAQPFCVLLLDEFEKADPQIYDVFLQVLGEGRLTDASGETTSFHNAIVLLTSNLGASAREQRSVGLTEQRGEGATGKAAEYAYWQRKVEQFFRPEFVNRLDQIVVFQPLSEPAMRQIARRELGEVLLREGFLRRNVLVEIDDNAIDLLLEQGFNPTYGARPLKRAVERLVVLPLARYLASHGRSTVDLLRLTRADGQLALSATSLRDQERSTVQLSDGLLATGQRRRHLDDRALGEAFADLRRKLQDWAERETVVEMRNARATGLAETHKPTFWDDGDAARATLARFYFLDRLLNRLQQLSDRAEYLEELAALVHRQRDPRYRAELVESYEQLDRDVAFLEVELLCAHLEENHSAILTIRRFGPSPKGDEAEPWLPQLATIYLRWAKRKGYDAEVFVRLSEEETGKEEGQPASQRSSVWSPLKVGDLESLIKQVQRLADARELVLSFQGTNVFGFLKGEQGVHRRNELKPSGERTQSLVEVRVESPGLWDAETWLAIMADEAEEMEDQPAEEKRKRGQKGKTEPAQPEELAVIRNYQFDGERSVRDLRTGVRISQVSALLAGELDEFILAYLRDEEAKQAWDMEQD